MSKIDKIRATAKALYETDDVVIDDDAAVEWAEDGAWVAARVWVTDDSVELVQTS